MSEERLYKEYVKERLYKEYVKERLYKEYVKERLYLYNKGNTWNFVFDGIILADFGSTRRFVDLLRWTQLATWSCQTSL